MMTFEEYLQKVWEPEGVLDDDMPDAFDKWLQDLDVDTWLEYGDDFAKLQITK